MIAAFLLLSALAAPAAELGLSLGADYHPDPDFDDNWGLRASGELAIRPWLRLGGVLGTSLRRDEGYLCGTMLLSDDAYLWADRVRLEHQGQLLARVIPAQGRLGAWQRNLGLHLGGGIVQATSTYGEVTAPLPFDLPDDGHWAPSLVYGLTGELRRDHLALRLRAEQLRYRVALRWDVTHHGEPVKERPVWVGFEGVWWL